MRSYQIEELKKHNEELLSHLLDVRELLLNQVDEQREYNEELLKRNEELQHREMVSPPEEQEEKVGEEEKVEEEEQEEKVDEDYRRIRNRLLRSRHTSS